MADTWLSIIGIGEDGLKGLSSASLDALASAEVVFGAPRHLALAGVGARGQDWPVPFSTAPVLALRGQKVAVLASGDPFLHGAGGSIARDLSPDEWRAYPAPSVFSLIAARLGWRLEEVACLGLHAAPLARMLPDLQDGRRLIVLLEGPNAVQPALNLLADRGFGGSTIRLAECVGGPQERLRVITSAPSDAKAPLALVIETRGLGLPRTNGLPEASFAHDGQITKSPVRALALMVLSPRPGQRLWDLGAGSGSISVEWCLAGGHAEAVEAKPERLINIAANIAAFGLKGRMTAHQGRIDAVLGSLPRPDAVFCGGGLDRPVLDQIWQVVPMGCRLVAHAVTLETEGLLMDAHARLGGQLMKVEISHAAPLGPRMRGWDATRPIVQWSVAR
jgi:precorrin-6Y C5,15-methyltransferase (decarboxylating)